MKLPSVFEPERLTSVRMLAVAVGSLMLALGTVLYGHVAASPVGPWLSILFSAAAVACTVVSVMLAQRR